MEGINLLAKNSCESDNSSENVISSGDGRPPNPISGVYRHSPSSGHPVGSTSCKKCLLRHPSLVKDRSSDVSLEGLRINSSETKLLPVLRSGAWTDIGSRSTMEDVYVCTDDFRNHYGLKNIDKGPSAFYGVKLFSQIVSLKPAVSVASFSYFGNEIIE